MSNPSLASMPAFLWDPHPSSSEAVELRHALLCATAELQSARAAAHEELRRMEAQAVQLSQLLDATTRERDELRRQCHALLLLLSSNPNPHPHPITNSSAGNTSAEEEDESSNGTSAPNSVPAVPPPYQDIKLEMAGLEEMAAKKGLPEKGKLVEAVVAAGPLLQTVLLAGPLPQWRHPPPAVRCFDIPLFTPGRELLHGEDEDSSAQAVAEQHKHVELGSRELTDGVQNFHFS